MAELSHKSRIMVEGMCQMDKRGVTNSVNYTKIPAYTQQNSAESNRDFAATAAYPEFHLLQCALLFVIKSQFFKNKN